VIADDRFVSRQAVGDYITSLGGEFNNSVNKSTSWLVVSVRRLSVLLGLCFEQVPTLGLLGFGVEAGWFQEQRQQQHQLACGEHNWLHELLSAWRYAMHV
jgi:hypothetical protein